VNAAPRELDFPLNRIAELGNELLQRVDALRSVNPILWSESNQVWLVTGHAEVTEGFAGTVPLSAHRLPGAAVAQIPPQDLERLLPTIMNATRSWLLNKDDAEHLRLRKLLVKAFGKSIVEGVRPHAQRFIHETLDAAGAKGEIEFVSEVARLIPARTILKLLGLSDDLVPRLHHWSQTLNQIGNVNVALPVLQGIDHTLRELREVFRPAFAARRGHPTDDFLSALVMANEAGDKLSEDEMFGTCDIVLIAGHDTTTNTMSLSVAALAEHPEACDYLRRHPEDSLNVVLELSRLVSMSTAMGRCVAEDFTWQGHELKKGQIVILFQGGANRDPKVYPNPDQLDFTRAQDRNMMFAPGAHHCIGHLLAKMQLAEFFPELVRRFDIELLDKQLRFGPTLGFRGLDSLRVKLHARH
jgi:pimeloyl-[acyl-carrier protein] synthase